MSTTTVNLRDPLSMSLLISILKEVINGRPLKVINGAVGPWVSIDDVIKQAYFDSEDGSSKWFVTQRERLLELSDPIHGVLALRESEGIEYFKLTELGRQRLIDKATNYL